MAKTRIKNTPTRLQGALSAASASTAGAAAVATTAPAATITTDAKTRLRQPNKPIEKHHATSSIIVSSSKRASSISSTTSTVSQASETPSAQSDIDAVPPQMQMIKNLTNRKPTATSKQTQNIAATLKNRKVFMITEKSGNVNDVDGTVIAGGQKRKMYLIMDENDTDNTLDNTQKYSKIENAGSAAERSKKVTLYTDNCTEFTENFEKILPEILNRIQSRADLTKLQNGVIEKSAVIVDEPTAAMERRAPITLPPKKNRNKILTANNGYGLVKQTSAATPVIVSPASSHLNASIINNTNNNTNINNNNINNNPKRHGYSNVQAAQSTVPHKNINLSTDFLFLMKMLPKLESIPEPEKNHVKNNIDKIITQFANKFDEDI